MSATCKAENLVYCPHCQDFLDMPDFTGICDGCDEVIDRDVFWASFPDATSLDYRPWLHGAVEEWPAPRLVVWDQRW